MQEIILKDILKEDYQRQNRQNNQKQKGPGTSDQSLFRLQNKFRKVHSLVMYYLTKFDDVI